jgi:hypothetical protein
MKFLAIVLSAVSLASYCDALSLYNPSKSLYNPAKANALSQKSVMQQTMGITRRETIQMPSTSPMVPYMVRIKCSAVRSERMSIYRISHSRFHCLLYVFVLSLLVRITLSLLTLNPPCTAIAP